MKLKNLFNDIVRKPAKGLAKLFNDIVHEPVSNDALGLTIPCAGLGLAAGSLSTVFMGAAFVPTMWPVALGMAVAVGATKVGMAVYHLSRNKKNNGPS